MYPRPYIQGNTLQNTYKSQPSLLEATKKNSTHMKITNIQISIYMNIFTYLTKTTILLWPNFKNFGSTMSCGICDSTTPFLACLRSLSYVFLWLPIVGRDADLNQKN